MCGRRVNCNVTEDVESFCKHFYTGELVRVHNYTRCTEMTSSDVHEHGLNRYFCDLSEIVKQQTNCSDPSRVGITCEINGYKSTVSKYIICFNATISSVCDDKIDGKCLVTSTCRIHRHFMCDDVDDCVDKADERSPICKSKTQATCRRRLRLGAKRELPIPISWLKDGVWD